MKSVLLAGGLGTRLAEESGVRPKPMVEIGGRPILLHIMAIYACHGFSDFVVACGYRGDVIKRYFNEIYMLTSDFTINLATGATEILNPGRFDWRVSCIDTGRDSTTGERIKRLAPLLGVESFMATYGDGVADVDLKALVAFHRSHGKLATVTAVRPAGRFGSLKLDGSLVAEFAEKVEGVRSWVNGGFFVFEPGVLDFISDEGESLEEGALTRLAAAGELMAFQHEGFWHPLDTVRDRNHLDEMWTGGRAPWRLPNWPF